MKYTIILEKEEEGGYSAQCLELPGAISQGETKELKDLITEMEFRVNQPDMVTDTDALVDRMGMMLKKVEWRG